MQEEREGVLAGRKKEGKLLQCWDGCCLSRNRPRGASWRNGQSRMSTSCVSLLDDYPRGSYQDRTSISCRPYVCATVRDSFLYESSSSSSSSSSTGISTLNFPPLILHAITIQSFASPKHSFTVPLSGNTW